MTRARFVTTSALATLTLALTAAACGGSDGPVLSEAGDRGRSISINRGCASCHGVDGRGGSGPTWVGLHGTEVELIDGSFVLADDEYLARAIVDPAAELRAGFGVQMPTPRLDDAEVDDIVAYIRDLAVAEN